jgi:hypothetical protein
MSEHTAEKDARCSRCDEVVGAFVIDGGRATIRLSTSSHGDTLPISCPRVDPPGSHPAPGDHMEARVEALAGEGDAP